jgi:hypothetical protein
VTGLLAAVEILCGLTQPDVIVVDGMLDDWQGVKGFAMGAGDGDADPVFRCNYDENFLYVSVNVFDDRLIRTKQGGAGEDHIVLSFGSSRVDVYPGHSEYNAKRKVTGSGLGKVEVADSLQPKGWSVELAIQLRRIPGWGKGVPTLPFKFELRDADQFVEKKVQSVVGTDSGRLSFAEGAELYKAFLAEFKLKRADVKLDTLAEMDGDPGLERVIWSGRIIGVLSDQYAVLQFPVPAKDVLEVKVVDLSGHKKSILARWVERGNGGSREVLGVFNVKLGGAPVRTFAHEIVKQMGPNRLTNAWSIEPVAELNRGPKGQKKSKAKAKAPKLPGRNAIVIRVGEVTGFTAQTWREAPAEDMSPILLPWGEAQQEVWAFQGDEVFGGQLTVSSGTR